MKTSAPRVLITLLFVGLAVIASLAMYWRYSHRPWTRDGQVRANVIGIAPRVAGPIIQFPVHDNQPVKKGDLLFEIDPATFQAAVESAAARVAQTQANALQARQNLERLGSLYETKVVDQQAYENAQDQYAAAMANVQAAQAQLESAKLNLGYTKIFAPVDGFLTNVNTSPGTYVNVGDQLIALVDASSFWIAAYFKETQIEAIHVGDKCRITLMGHGKEPFEGEVRSIAWGIFQEDGSTVQLLPQVSQTIDWVRLPNRFPVRVHITGKPPVPLRIGQTVSVAMAKQ